MNSNSNEKDNKFNDEPVCYCANCLSLAIKKLNGSDMDVCLDCGNDKFIETDIFTWQKLYVEEYGESFLTKNQPETEIPNGIE